eukprot:5116310-Ditylum_brightwellii.AAC.1
MSSLNDVNSTGTKQDAAAYHKHFNPSEGGKQRRGIYAKKGRKHKNKIGKNHQEKEENNKQVKVTNNVNANKADVLME